MMPTRGSCNVVEVLMLDAWRKSEAERRLYRDMVLALLVNSHSENNLFNTEAISIEGNWRGK